jgi:hypothetical protein
MYDVQGKSTSDEKTTTYLVQRTDKQTYERRRGVPDRCRVRHRRRRSGTPARTVGCGSRARSSLYVVI